MKRKDFHRKLPHYIFFHTQKQASTNIPTLVNACSPILTEINFYKRPDGRSKTVPELPERGLAGGGFLLLRATAQESSATSQELAAHAQTLQAMLSRFRLVRLDTIIHFISEI